MSLSALNTPPIVSSAMAGLAISLPSLENVILSGSIPWMGIKTLNALSYAINLYAVSQPGRLDGQEQQKMIDNDLKGMDAEKGVTLVAPSGWAFAIWAPIFAGELSFTISQFLVPETSSIATIIKQLSAPFITGQLFQSLWCAAFRPKYEGSLMLISSAGLAGAAYSLSKVHAAYALREGYTSLQYCLFFLPTSLHFGWLTAATLVNFNGAVARMTTCEKTIAITGHLSVVAATIAGVAVTVSRGAPVYGGVITWALVAVADGMKKRIEKSKKDDNTKGLYGALVQQRLSTLGAIITFASSIVTAHSLFN